MLSEAAAFSFQDSTGRAPWGDKPIETMLRERRPLLLRFEEGSAQIAPQIARTLERAAQAYRTNRFAWVRFSDTPDARIARARAQAVRIFLESRRIWTVPVARQDGRWATYEWDEADDHVPVGLALIGIPGVRPVPVPPPPPPEPVPPPPPEPVPPPPPPAPPLDPPQAVIVRNLSVSNPPRPPRGEEPIAAAAGPSGLSQMRAWLTTNGALTKPALAALAGACVRVDGELTADCEAAVRGGEGEFAAVPQDARAEFSLLLNGCRALRQGRTCWQSLALEQEFRALQRGRLDPRPLRMREDVKTTFTARIIYEGEAAAGGRAGVPIGQSSASTGAGSSAQTFIPFSGKMCFSLTADPADFRIRQIGEPCPEVIEGGGRVKYDPQWEVTPLRSGKLELKLATELYVGDQKKEYRHEPYPLIIDVAAKPSFWDRLDATLKRATGTVNLTVGLAQALGALFAAVAGWGIWALFRRRKRQRAAASPPP